MTLKKISIDPITRLEGHGKIEIFLNDAGSVERAFLQIPELRGFEKFVEGRPSEDMPQITSRICGVCPGAHHVAATKALDSLYNVEPTYTAKLIRELYYNLHFFEDHILHFYILGGPDFVVGPDADKSKRNILGVIDKVGVETGKKVIEIRARARDLISDIAGKNIHPVFGLPGGVSKQLTKEMQEKAQVFAKDAIEFAKFTLNVFNDIVLSNKQYLDIILSDAFFHKTYYMGMVDKNNKVNFYDGDVRVIDPDGNEILKFKPNQYLDIISEHVEEWSYIKFPFLKSIGWKGFVDGSESGIYRVAPLARLNVADGMATPLAQEEFERYFATLKSKPVHYTLANHWARLVEVMYAAERIQEIANIPELISDDTRNLNFSTPNEGFGIVEAPRGTLIHHYKTDKNGVMNFCNLIVASLGNSAAMCMSVDKAAKEHIKDGKLNNGFLNIVEMAFRAYDPCFGCATHSLPGKMPFIVNFRNKDKILYQASRNEDGIIVLD